MQTLSTLLVLVLIFISVGEADAQTRKPVDPKSRLNKIVAEVSQINEGNLVGSAWFYGENGCYAVTNYHVAFGQTKRTYKHPRTGKEVQKIVLVNNPGPGHKVNLSFDLNPKLKEYTRTVVATVVAFGNFEQGTIDGVAEDLALLRLTPCVGPDYAGLEVDRSEVNQKTPPGRLTTVSSMRTPESKIVIATQEVCWALAETPGAGLVGHNCESFDGMSGSMLLADGKIVGVSVMGYKFEDGVQIGIAISAKYLNKFLNDYFNQAPAK